MATDNLSYVEPIFETENAVIREGELTLVDMWYRYSAKKLAKERGVEYSDELYEEAKKLCPPPKNVDYRINLSPGGLPVAQECRLPDQLKFRRASRRPRMWIIGSIKIPAGIRF